jgi:hypothetical protein
MLKPAVGPDACCATAGTLAAAGALGRNRALVLKRERADSRIKIRRIVCPR